MKSKKTLKRILKKMHKAAEKRAWKKGFDVSKGKMIGRYADAEYEYFWE
jgi:hypothetical protein